MKATELTFVSSVAFTAKCDFALYQLRLKADYRFHHICDIYIKRIK
ncbi:hypothetical protein GCHA_0494 [Paraglaciecola chathamensis S18K6]|uniref:Uncharacterized protein n=2 Tax=Paraglaciecola chathamensis TaxID=368405 RepID=A0ABQ0IG59_9ALTE|nr:hypothetical protein GAGA_5022 [Paraglaciecola agarilytica NO2]GAC08457.1 hypothetical protein GCHA_0494 [Paraglaciecola chathamensis S18K6]